MSESLVCRQITGLKLWTLPGGKVKRGESLRHALKREVYEESGLRVEIGTLLMVLDRRDKDAIALLFSVVLEQGPVKIQHKQREIEKASFRVFLPKKASPAAEYFWPARRGPMSKAPTVPASTYQVLR